VSPRGRGLPANPLITVRIAAPADYERIGALTVAAYDALPVGHMWGGYDEKMLDTGDRADHGDLLVAVADERVVGSVMYVADSSSEWSEWTEPGEAQFRLLAVDPTAHGLGAGGALVLACIERATAASQPIAIHTTPWMETAQRIYARFGFVRRPDRDVPYDEWNQGRDLELPNEWIGQSFLAYCWTPPGR
jgi:predicted N-acetyltransferase YhbS